MNTVKSVNKLNCPVNAYKQANIAIKNVELEGTPPLFNLANFSLNGYLPSQANV